MNAFVLVGSEEKSREYLEKFIKDSKIPSYFVTNYEEFKIADARNLQKLASQKLGIDEKRVFSISHPTVEAQNSLLKTLEELPEGIIVLFSIRSKDDLLPTVLSRSKIVYLERSNTRKDQNISNFEEETRKILNKFELSAKDIEDIVLLKRSDLIGKIAKDNSIETNELSMLKKLHKNYKLVKSNNINIRLALENSLN